MATNNALNTSITEFNSDPNLAGASNTQGVTTLAAKSYADSIFAGGQILQIETTTRVTGASSTAIIPTDNTIPQQSEGTEFFTVSITPISDVSKLYVEVYISTAGVSSPGAMGFVGALFRDNQNDALIATYSGDYPKFCSLAIIVPSVDIVSTTFKFRFGRNVGGTVYCNLDASGDPRYDAANVAYISAMEVLTP